MLSEFGTSWEPLGVTEVSERLGMTKNMVFRALNTLVEEGYLVRTESGRRYELGFRIVELNNPNAAEPDLRALAMPTVSAMQQESGETVVLTIRAGSVMVVIDGIEANAVVRSRAPLGSMFPLHASPAARVVLANLSDDAIGEYLTQNKPLAKLTKETLTDPDDIWKDIAEIRTRGYARGFGDATLERRSVAFAILDSEADPWGAISVGGPKERFTEEKLAAILPALQKMAMELNEQTRLFQAPVVRSWFNA